MTCLCGDTQCPSCGLAQGTLERDTRRHITVWDWREIHEAVESALDDPRIDRVKLKLRKKNAGLSDEDEQAAIRNGAPCFLSIVVHADPMPDREIQRIEAVADRAEKGPWVYDGRGGIDMPSVDGGGMQTNFTTDEDCIFIAESRTSVPALCRALRQAKAMIPRESYFASLKGAKKWVAYRLREIRIEGKPLPTVLKYNVSVRTQVAVECEEGEEE